MKTKQQVFRIQSKTPPVVEVDSSSRSAYVRFKKTKVAKTVVLDDDGAHVAVDLDAKGAVVGIEAVGVSDFSIRRVLGAAKAKFTGAQEELLERARYVPADVLELA